MNSKDQNQRLTWASLSEPQRKLMWELAEGSRYVASHYAPLKKLLALELVCAALRGGLYALTPAGWVALQPLWGLPAGWTFKGEPGGGLARCGRYTGG